MQKALESGCAETKAAEKAVEVVDEKEVQEQPAA